MDFDALAFLGRLHPLILHLPIGLFAAVLLLEVIARDDRAVVRRRVLWLAAATSLLAVASGWMLGDEGGYDAELLDDHRWMGVGVAVFFVGAVLLERRTKWRRGMLAMTGIALALAGHHGGSMTHGVTFLSAKAPSWLAPFLAHEEQAAAPQPGEGSSDGGVAHPAVASLVRACLACHGPSQQKAGLRMDTADGLLSLVEPGDPALSELFRRIALPEDHSEFMPTEGGALSDEEVLTVVDWIREGAPTAGLAEAVAAWEPPAPYEPSEEDAAAEAEGN